MLFWKILYLNKTGIENGLDRGCPTRGPRATCGPLDNLAQPFLLLSSFTCFFKGGRIFLGRENFSREANPIERAEKI